MNGILDPVPFKMQIHIWGSPRVRGGQKILKISQKLQEGAIPVSNYFARSLFYSSQNGESIPSF